MRKHVVHVEDPWYGDYVYLKFGPAEHQGIIIGPLRFYCLVIHEALDNQGRSWRRGNRFWKSCHHIHVEGKITGKPNNPDGTIRVINPFSGGTYTIVTETSPPPPRPGIRVTLTHTLSVTMDQRAGKAKYEATVSYLRQRKSDGYVLNQSSGWVKFEGKLNVDERTGEVIINSLVVTSASSNPITATITAAVNPWGALHSTFGLGWRDFKSAHDIIMDALDELAGVRPNNNLRDGAIFDAVDNLQIEDLNLLENCRELPELLKLLEPLKEILKIRGGNPMDILKLFANLHLWWKYVIKTGILDIQSIWHLIKYLRKHRRELLNELDKLLQIGHGTQHQTIESPYGPIEDTYVATLCYRADTSSFRGWTNSLAMMGFTPRLADLWDLIPFSFVIDWFIPIGDAIDNTEDMNFVDELPFESGMLTRKLQQEYSREFEKDNQKWSVSLRLVDYSRKVIEKLPKDMWLGVVFKDPRKQLLTAGSLAVTWFTGHGKPGYHVRRAP